MAFNLGNPSGFPSATSTAPLFGFGGTSTAAAKPAFGTPGFSFGAPAASTSFGFGSNPATSTTATATASGFGGFGTTTTGTGSFGFGGLGTSQPTTGTAPGTSLFSGFGQQAATGTTGFGGFGGFGAKTAAPVNTGFRSFGTGLGLGLGQPQQQQQQEAVPSPVEALYNAVFNCNVYGDERDSTLARWNLLQALWGTGKGYYSQTAPPVEFTLQNPLCRFKAIGYSCIPTTDNKEGLVAITFNKTDDQVRSQQAQLVNSLNTVLGNKPNLTLTVDCIKPMSETKCQVIIYVQEKGATGSLRRIPGTELCNYLLQPMQKQQLTQLGTENVFAQVLPERSQLDEYLERPPAGIDPRLWKQALLDNPNPERYIPVPMVGFGEVQWRLRCQERETRLHQAFLDQVSEDIAALQRRHAGAAAQISEQRRRFVELQHRVLQVLVRQEVSRKVGLALTPEEEILRSQLEGLHMQLSAPAQYKARLNELLALIRQKNCEASQRDAERYSMDPSVQDDIKQFLMMEQNGMAHLIQTIQSDMASLKLMKDGMMSLLQGH